MPGGEVVLGTHAVRSGLGAVLLGGRRFTGLGESGDFVGISEECLNFRTDGRAEARMGEVERCGAGWGLFVLVSGGATPAASSIRIGVPQSDRTHPPIFLSPFFGLHSSPAHSQNPWKTEKWGQKNEEEGRGVCSFPGGLKPEPLDPQP